MNEDGVWQPDEFLTEFAGEAFDVEQHATKILKQGNMNEEVAKLTTSLQSLDTLIQQHVCSHYTDLLSHAVASSELEQSLAVMATHIQSLQLSTDRVRARVREPYDKIKAGTTSLARLQQTADILRRVIRILQLSKRLASAMGQGETDLAKAASGLAELATLLQEDLTGLEVVEGEARRVRQWRAEVERQGEQLLVRGLATGNQAQLGTGLQVFYNLGTLPEVVGNMVEELHTKLKATWVEGLDIKRISDKSQVEGVGRNGKAGPGKAAMPGPGNMAAFRATLWSNIDSLLDSLHAHMVKMFHLQRLLCKKVDPVTHQPYISTLSTPSLVLHSWSKLTTMVKDSLAAAQAKSNFVRQACEGEYPKMVKLYSELWVKMKYTGAQYSTNTGQMEEVGMVGDIFVGEEMEEGLRESLAQFENAYLARSLSRLFDPVNLMFSGTGVPSQEEVNNIFTVMSSELSIAMVEGRLLSSVTKNICKAVSLFCVKCEGCVDSEASQVIGQPTTAQLQNVGIVNTLAVFGDGLANLCTEQISVLGQQRVDTLLLAGQEVEKQMEGATGPLLASVGDSVEAILLTVHKEDFSLEVDSTNPAPACSLYMKELQAFLERIARDFLSTFTCKDFLATQLQPLAEKTIQRFVLQGSLVRPLGSGGAMRLASDCAQLEFALSSILGPSGQSAIGPTGLTALGGSYRLLRAFRSLLFLTPADMASFPGLGTTVPYSIALHLLISRCPAVLPSPAASLGWSLARYTNWLEDHQGERERLLLVQGAVEAYVAAARARQDKSFVPQYPVLIEVLQRGLAAY